MPQCLKIFVGKKLVAKMVTSHRSDTCYDVCWDIVGVTQRNFQDVNTGIQRQPSEMVERQNDFRNDFLHAQRAIGAALETLPQLLDELGSNVTECGCVEIVQIHLSTNDFDRGTITIQQTLSDGLIVLLQIGTGPKRPANAIPDEVTRFEFTTSDIGSASSPLAQVRQVFVTRGPDMLRSLAECA